jgi:alkaline phosphatase D
MAGEDQPIQRIAFGSCAKQDQPQPIWEPILGSQPDVFLMIGDNIYGDTDDMKVLQAKWKKLAGQRGLRALRKSARFLATWDDHDYGRDDAGAEYPFRQESQQAFLDFLDEPADSPRRMQEGVYDSTVIGPVGKRVQFILLDTRYHRSPLKKNGLERVAGKPYPGPYAPTDDESATMLGETQWAWLAEQLQVEAEVRIIASSVQVLANEHAWEKWGNFPKERQKLFNLIREAKASGVIFISGDRHHAELSRNDDVLSYPLFDVTSSSLNAPSKPKTEPNTDRLGELYTPVNFGWIEIDWAEADPVITLAIRQLNGKAAVADRFPHSRLEAE